jgi:hypothetical protein
MSDEPADDLALADEILQVMYWLRGEHLDDDVDAPQLARVIGAEPGRIGVLLERLLARGLVVVHGSRFALSETGVREGGRRFADEFADLTKAGHGECGDPDCDCHRTGSTDDCRHRRVS